MKSATLVAILVTVAVVPLAPGSVRAQSSRVLNALGYGMLMGSLGLAATANATCEGADFICIPPQTVAATLGGAALGLALGARMSTAANRAVAEGRRVQGAHLAGLSVGTVLGGATLGLVAGALLVNPTGEGTILGSDEQTLTLLALAGGTLGVLHLRRSWPRLTGATGAPDPTLFDVNPVALVHGRLGMTARIRF